MTKKSDLMPGTLDMMILKTLTRGAQHGYGIASHIGQASDELLRVEEGSLYPALHRIEQDGWITSEWGVSENGRKAKFYDISARGRRPLNAALARRQVSVPDRRHACRHQGHRRNRRHADRDGIAALQGLAFGARCGERRGLAGSRRDLRWRSRHRR